MIQIPRPVAERAGEEILLPECRALVRLLSASEVDDDVFVRYQILAATNPSAVGITTSEKFATAPNQIGKLATLLKRAGVIERGTPNDETADYDPSDLAGTEMVVDIVQREVPRKDGTTYKQSQWPWGAYWRWDDHRVAEFVGAIKRPPVVPAAPRPTQSPAMASADSDPF